MLFGSVIVPRTSIDGANAVVGVQNKRITTTNGCYNLTWDFSERGPILPRTTIEYHLGYGTNPVKLDSDLDGLDDGDEVSLGTIPTTSDSDGDGIPDGVEVLGGTNPKSVDTDGDGLRDGWEVANGLKYVYFKRSRHKFYSTYEKVEVRKEHWND